MKYWICLGVSLMTLVLTTACDQVTAPAGETTTSSTATDLALATSNLAITYAKGEDAKNVLSDLTLPKSSGSVAIAWASSDAKIVTTTGAVTRPSVGDPDAMVTLTATLSEASTSVTASFDLVVKAKTTAATDTADVEAAKLALVLTFGTGDTKTSVTQDLVLALKDDNGVVIAWSSDSTALTAAGHVTRPDFGSANAVVNLKATLTKGAATATKSFELTVPAQAALATYAVTFDSTGGSAVTGLSGLASGSKITAPTDPTQAGFTFGGWYTDVGLTVSWKFDTDVVTSNVTLYAKWVAVTGSGGLTVSGAYATVTVTLVGQTSILSKSASMTVTATPSQTADSFQWWIDGVLQSSTTVSLVVAGSGLMVGPHQLMAAALSNGTLFSTTYLFSVQ